MPCWCDSRLFTNVLHLILLEILKCIQLGLAYRPFQMNFALELVHLGGSESHQIVNEMNTSDWWSDTHHQVPATPTVVQLICAYEKHHLVHFPSGNLAWMLYLTIVEVSNVFQLQSENAHGFFSGCSHVSTRDPEILIRLGMRKLGLDCSHSGL